ncbi:MAG: DUF1634 domain-containing protein [Bacteroidota bacterium]|nr:DUF1634 domain-containing protein [Bacteroidota bacterium]
MKKEIKISDYDIEAVMGRLLITGVIISGTLILIGGIYYLIQHGFSIPHFKTFRGEPSNLRSVSQIMEGVIHFDSLSIIQMGLLLLIATPVARVIFAVIGFFIEKDFLYVAISLIVLGIIAYSIFSVAAA